jgi:O-methyltransferase involved in polyketide biosynthesis
MSDDPETSRVPVELTGVPETLLWNLYHRAVAARGRTPLLDDPAAVDLVGRLDHRFDALDGGAERGAEWHAMRVRAFDAEVRRFLAARPGGTVVALGEGLETQFQRVDDGRVRWVSIDLPETLALRRRVLPDGPRQRSLAFSATDTAWPEHVGTREPVLITAQGLLMYLPPDEVAVLIERCARHFPGQALLFDAVPGWMRAARARAGARQEHAQDDASSAEWLWSNDAATRNRLAALPGVATLRRLPTAYGRSPLFGRAFPTLRRLPGLGSRLPDFHAPVFRVDFAGPARDTDGPSD